MRTQSLNVLPLKPGVGQYIAIHATLTAGDFFLAYFYTSGVFEPPNSKLFEKSRLSPPLGLRILPLFKDSKIDLDVVDDTTVSDTPPWSQPEPRICLSSTIFFFLKTAQALTYM